MNFVMKVAPAAGLLICSTALACGGAVCGSVAASAGADRDEQAGCCGDSKEHAAVATVASPTHAAEIVSCCGSSADACAGDAAPAADTIDPVELAERNEHYTDLVAQHVPAAAFDSLEPRYQKMIASALEQHLGENAEGGFIPAFCFQPGTNDRVVSVFKDVFDTIAPNRYQLTNRWSGAVASGSAGSLGEPITLTWSFVPDGTFVPSGVGEGGGNSDLFARMDAFYGGDRAAWQQVYFDMFDRWEAITGLNFVFEPNDDGAPLFDAPGVLGVRGDLRMAGKSIDGNSGILAYNFFPQVGDMVVDTADNFYADISNDSQKLFNVLKHEHGHGMGLLHVCPIEESKLMEPFVSTNFTGAQHDDIRGAHRLYGDFFEPNDTPSLATDLGNVAPGDTRDIGDLPGQLVSFGSRASIAGSDADVYRFTLTSPATLTGAAFPVGLNYQDNPQNCGGAPGSCCSGVFIDSNVQGDLRIEILDASGLVLASQNANGAGQNEVLAGVPLTLAGTYFLRVSTVNNNDQVQLYRADLSFADPPFLGPAIQAPNGVPSELDPGVGTNFLVTIDPRDDVLVPGSEELLYRGDGGAFISTPLIPTGVPGEYNAPLPAFACADEPQFYIAAEGQTDGVVTFPPTAPSTVFEALVGTTVVAADLDFETSPGWTVSSTASDGQWDRGVPVNNGRDDPPADFDGSGQCWLTDNDQFNDNSDVDGGATTLISPVYDVTGGAEVSYAYWFADSVNPIGPEDFFRVDVSFNGGSSWQTVRNYDQNDTVNQWQTDSFSVSPADATANFRIRFIVAENDPGDVLEAGLDAFKIVGVQCEDPVVPDCPGDTNGDGAINADDLLAILGAFGTATTDGPAGGDVTDDGLVNADDLLLVLGSFGVTCP